MTQTDQEAIRQMHSILTNAHEELLKPEALAWTGEAKAVRRLLCAILAELTNMLQAEH